MDCKYKLINVPTKNNKENFKTTMETIILSVGVSLTSDESICTLPLNDVLTQTQLKEYVLPITPNSSPISQTQLYAKEHTCDKIYNSCFNEIIVEEYLGDIEKFTNNDSMDDSTNTSNNDNIIINTSCDEETEYLSMTYDHMDGKDDIVVEVNGNEGKLGATLNQTHLSSFIGKCPDSSSSHHVLFHDGGHDELEKENKNDDQVKTDDIDDDNDGDNSSEPDLTNLGWLIDLKNLTTWSDNNNANGRNGLSANSTKGSSIIHNINIIDDIDDDDGCLGPIISDQDLSEERFNKFMGQVKQSQVNYAEREHIYKIEPMEKPPFNYAQIIAMAMMENGRMTLKEICKWIQDRFAYFRYNKNWNNSIRHNLSLHFCFTKIARDKTEKGKGGYWELSMNTAKSEKKRIRNRKKHRDESGRFSNNQMYKNSNLAASLNGTSKHFNEISHVTKIEDTLLCNRNFSNDDNIMKDIETMSGHEIIFLEHQPNKQNGDELLESVNSGTSTNSNDITNFDDGNTSYYMTETIPSNMDSDEIYLENDLPLCDTAITVHYSTTAFVKQAFPPKIRANETITTTDDTVADVILCNQPNGGPNVIVEPLPFGLSLSHMDTVLDIEREFSSLVNMPDPELTEEAFFDYGNW